MKTLRFFVLIISFLILLFISFYDLRGVSYNFGTQNDHKTEKSLVGRAIFFVFEKTLIREIPLKGCKIGSKITVYKKHTWFYCPDPYIVVKIDNNYSNRVIATKIFLIIFLISIFYLIYTSKYRFIVAKKIMDIWKGI